MIIFVRKFCYIAITTICRCVLGLLGESQTASIRGMLSGGGTQFNAFVAYNVFGSSDLDADSGTKVPSGTQKVRGNVRGSGCAVSIQYSRVSLDGIVDRTGIDGIV